MRSYQNPTRHPRAANPAPTPDTMYAVDGRPRGHHRRATQDSLLTPRCSSVTFLDTGSPGRWAHGGARRSDAPDGNRREPKADEVEDGEVRSERSGPQSQARPARDRPRRAAYEAHTPRKQPTTEPIKKRPAGRSSIHFKAASSTNPESRATTPHPRASQQAPPALPRPWSAPCRSPSPSRRSQTPATRN